MNKNFKALSLGGDTRIENDFDNLAEATGWLQRLGRNGYVIERRSDRLWYHCAAVKEGAVITPEQQTASMEAAR